MRDFRGESPGDGGDANDTGVGHAEDWYDNEGGNGQNVTDTLLGGVSSASTSMQGPPKQAKLPLKSRQTRNST